MNSDFPFEWNLRLSKRAKRPRIIINTYGAIELVWPHRMSQHGISSMLSNHETWIVKHSSAARQQQSPSISIPEKITLSALQQTWFVQLKPSEKPFVLIENAPFLIFKGNLDNEELMRGKLNVWIKNKGKVYLKPWLADTAKMMNVSYKSVAIRLQKGRWGSCSTGKRINLNAALLFLPDYLVRHVLVHELAHLKHHNHSSAFWQEVEKWDKGVVSHRQLLKKKAVHVPAWLTQPFSKDARNA